MNFQGMDPDEVEGIGRQISSEAQSLQGIIRQLDGIVNTMQANWLGDDSNRFHSTYTTQYRQQMNQAVQQLEQLSSAAIRNANEQRSVSR
ncbi:MAG: WXG100 family type VII secretion target [Jatrophihabitans sp.]|uniref:WXG100 family type VII secretion target n=1 Tax=Jatrophihabitans sp. TaxID=1932789 RepID=UPI003F7D8029